MERIKVTELDHIVLNVGDIDRSLKFYIEVLGLQPERLDEFKAGKVGFPSVRINADTIIDLFPIRGAGDAEQPDREARGKPQSFLHGGGATGFLRDCWLSGTIRNPRPRRTRLTLGRPRQSDFGLFSRSRRE